VRNGRFVFLEAEALAKWLPPNGFACTVHHLFKLRERNENGCLLGAFIRPDSAVGRIFPEYWSSSWRRVLTG
jgi:hypothetical protein